MMLCEQIKTITIVGTSGSGKTTLADGVFEYLSNNCDYKWDKFPAGDVFRREMARLGRKMQLADSVPPEVDLAVDGKELEAVGSRTLIVGRTIAALVEYEIGQNIIDPSSILRIGVNCPLVERARRAQPKWNAKLQNLEYEQVSGVPIPTLPYVMFMLWLRDWKDMRRYERLYREKGIRWYSNLSGSKFNDVVMDSSKMTVEQELKLVTQSLSR